MRADGQGMKCWYVTSCWWRSVCQTDEKQLCTSLTNRLSLESQDLMLRVRKARTWCSECKWKGSLQSQEWVRKVVDRWSSDKTRKIFSSKSCNRRMWFTLIRSLLNREWWICCCSYSLFLFWERALNLILLIIVFVVRETDRQTDRQTERFLREKKKSY